MNGHENLHTFSPYDPQSTLLIGLLENGIARLSESLSCNISAKEEFVKALFCEWAATGSVDTTFSLNSPISRNRSGSNIPMSNVCA
jgi:hypothetical protein